MPAYRDQLPRTYIKAHDFDLAKHGYKGPFRIEEKIDGEWSIWKPGEMYGRRMDWRNLFVNKWDTLPKHLKDSATAAFDCFWGSIPEESRWIVAELAVLGGTSSDVVKAITAGDKDERLHFVCHSIPAMSVAPTKIRELFAGRFRIPQLFDPLKPRHTFKKQSELDDILSVCDKRGWEGVVLWPDRKNSFPFRLKVVNTLDVVITGIEMAGAGKFFGMVGSLKCAWLVNGKQIAVGKVGGGWDVPARKELDESIIGRSIEVKTRGFASRGKMRHATFIRFRDDKSPNDCLAPQWWIDRYMG